MAQVNQYRVWCTTDNVWVETWDTVEPTVCPDNNTHAIDTTQTSIVDHVAEEFPTTADGELIAAPTYGHFDEDAHFKGMLVCGSGIDVDTVVDHKITSEIFVHGGWYWSNNAQLGDYAEFSVVDKDDILGLFSLYGLTPGVDVIELGKYVETVFLNPAGDQSVHLNPPSVANVVSGLYMRTKVHTTTDEEVCLGATYLWFEV